MSINTSFFKKSFLTGLALALAFGAVAAVSAQAHSTKDNSQVTVHGTGYVAGLTTDQNKLAKVGASGPNVCAATNGGTCKCPKVGAMCVICPTPVIASGVCNHCYPPAQGSTMNPNFCVKCPSNPKMMIACRIYQPVQTGGTVSGTQPAEPTNTGSAAPILVSPVVNPPTNSGGGSTSGNPNPQPNPTPVNATCPSNPHMMIACQAGGNPNCPYLEVCRAGE